MSKDSLTIKPIIGDGYWIDPLNPECPRCKSRANLKIGWDEEERKENRKCYTCGNIWPWKYIPREIRYQIYLKRLHKEKRIKRSKPKPPPDPSIHPLDEFFRRESE